jgi:coenzyme F420-0:L-glutamate ligase/coenzyme F420-1:gamma-L-glutamate ligase
MNMHEARKVSGARATAHFTALAGVPTVKPGDDLVGIIAAALTASNEILRDGDILIIAQKIVSKAENRFVRLRDVTPSAEARRLAREVDKDARLVELILRESSEVVRHRRDLLIVAHKLGLVLANGGIDRSNVGRDGAEDDTVLLLPANPDQTAADLCGALRARFGIEAGVIINDSLGRAFRKGTVGVAIGASGVATLADLRGTPDLHDRPLQSTEVGLADEIAAAASLLMGQANEGRPIVVARGIPNARGRGTAGDLIRPKAMDTFRTIPAAAIAGLLGGRRSIRQYTLAPVPADLVEQVLDAAMTAPSAHNRQPWRFAVLTAAGAKERLATAMGERLRADRARDGDPAEMIEQDVARSVRRITGAPVAVVVCLTMEDMDVYPDARRAAAEQQMAVQGTAMAMQNLLLAAHAAGLGASIMCAPLFCPDSVRAALALPPQWQPQALVTLGYPANGGKPFQRRALREFVHVVEG